jgi:hypothetical protein
LLKRRHVIQTLIEQRLSPLSPRRRRDRSR